MALTRTVEAVWIPLYIGKRRGRCSTRKHKTHNCRAMRYIRRTDSTFALMAAGEIRRIGGLRVIV